MSVTTDVLQVLWSAMLAMTAATLVLMVLPRLLRRHFGAGVAYAAWWLMPAVLVASVLPIRVVETAVGNEAATKTLQALVEPVMQSITIPRATATNQARLWLWIWLAGAVLMALRLWAQQRRFVRGLGTMRPLRDDLWEAKARHGLPALLGVLHVRIVLPEDFELRFSPRERQLMLAHERRHRSRGDHLANFAFAGARCVFWCNPLMHLAVSRFRHDQELACDQAVIAAHPDSRRAYGEAMLKTFTIDRLAPLGCHWGFSHPLKERVMQLKTREPSPWARRLGAAVVTTLTLGAGFAAWSAQPGRVASHAMAPSPHSGAMANALIKLLAEHAQVPRDWQGNAELARIELHRVIEAYCRDGVVPSKSQMKALRLNPRDITQVTNCGRASSTPAAQHVASPQSEPPLLSETLAPSPHSDAMVDASVEPLAELAQVERDSQGNAEFARTELHRVVADYCWDGLALSESQVNALRFEPRDIALAIICGRIGSTPAASPSASQ